LKPNLRVDPETKKPVLYDEYSFGENQFIQTIISPEEGDEIMLSKVSRLDEKDSSIIQYTLNQRDERFYTDKRIIVDLRELVHAVYHSESDKAYNLVKERLKKIGRYRIEGKIKNSNQDVYREFLFNFFQSVIIKKDVATGRTYAEILFSDILHEQYINNQTVQIYSHFMKKLENPISRILIYAFPMERLESYLNEENCRKSFDYNYFSNKIRFRSKRIETNLKLVEASLKEFKEHQILIEEYKRVGTGFEIILIPLSDYEKQDFFSSSPLQFIEG
jgi:hypothetical protein